MAKNSPQKVRRLALFGNRAGSNSPTSVPPPTLPEVVYTKPNPDGSRKLCMNCTLWDRNDHRCHIFATDVIVPPDAICNYHVYGSELAVTEVKMMSPVSPTLAGFMQVPGGTSCDLCSYYTHISRRSGSCVAVCDETGAYAIVEDLGCCSRWTPKD